MKSFLDCNPIEEIMSTLEKFRTHRQIIHVTLVITYFILTVLRSSALVNNNLFYTLAFNDMVPNSGPNHNIFSSTTRCPTADLLVEQLFPRIGEILVDLLEIYKNDYSVTLFILHISHLVFLIRGPIKVVSPFISFPANHKFLANVVKIMQLYPTDSAVVLCGLSIFNQVLSLQTLRTNCDYGAVLDYIGECRTLLGDLGACEIILNSITTSCTNGGVTRGVHDGKLKMIVRGGIDILDYRDRFPFFLL